MSGSTNSLDGFVILVCEPEGSPPMSGSFRDLPDALGGIFCLPAKMAHFKLHVEVKRPKSALVKLWAYAQYLVEFCLFYP